MTDEHYFLVRPVGAFDTWGAAWAALQLAETPDIPEPEGDGCVMVPVRAPREKGSEDLVIVVDKQRGTYTVSIGPWFDEGLDKATAELALEQTHEMGVKDMALFCLDGVAGGAA